MHHLLSFIALLGLFAFPLSAIAQDLALKRVMLAAGLATLAAIIKL